MKLNCLLVCAFAALTLPALSQNAPFARHSSLTTADALKQAPKMDPALVPDDRAFQAAADRLKRSPRDAAARKTYVDAAYKYGHAAMMDRGKLPPPVQYRAALALYRKALAVNPHHAPSLQDKKLIEDIYQQMGMGIPK